MSVAHMKEELHQRLWQAQERWLELRLSGVTKQDLKLRGIREHGDPAWAMRLLLFTGKTRVTYERILKRFVGFCHERGVKENRDTTRRDMRDYVQRFMDRGMSESYLDTIRSAIVKFGAVYGKYESFHSMSKKLGEQIRQLVADGLIAGPAHQRISTDVAAAAIDRLRELDAAAGEGRAYHLAAELQRRCGLRAEEATERLTPDRLVDGHVIVNGKGGRQRRLPVPADLFARLQAHFASTRATLLAPERAYETAFRRAVKAVGGRSTGTHALRRLWAVEFHAERYAAYLAKGITTEAASAEALADTLDALGHGRDRAELRAAYLRVA